MGSNNSKYTYSVVGCFSASFGIIYSSYISSWRSGLLEFVPSYCYGYSGLGGVRLVLGRYEVVKAARGFIGQEMGVISTYENQSQ